MDPQIPKGFRDFLPERMRLRKRLMATMTDVFERFGFEPLDTPCLEYAETLLGKYGEEGDRLIYKFQDRGERMVALRYDLTIPLSRVVAMHPEIIKPFKRYHIAPVWRADKPQKGRFREFYQCDIDIIGATSMYADGELLVITYTVLKELGFKNFIIRINNRKILNAFAVNNGIPEDRLPDFLRSLDKLDKTGLEGVFAELTEKGLLSDRLRSSLASLTAEGAAADHEACIALLDGLVQGHALGQEGVAELRTIHETLKGHDVDPACYRFDFTLARGLDYYTGPIFETIVTEPKIGSITGGGRYDNLIGLFSKETFPATGTSFGLERLITIMEELGSAEAKHPVTQVLITQFDRELMPRNLRIARMLRDAGINTEVYFSPDKLKKQLTYASHKAIPFVAILGPDEDSAGKITVKNMSNGTQETLLQTELAAWLHAQHRNP
ncbi:MAG: histidine--tRNA ligase [Deltaproteobacteria bacterium]|nr:histidine--tRNA ligase [Deltaproteobacteria bacterium]